MCKRSRIRESRSRRGTCATDYTCVVDLPNTTTHQTAGMRPPGLTTILLRNPTSVSPTVVCEASHNAMDVVSVWIGLVSKTKRTISVLLTYAFAFFVLEGQASKTCQ